MSSSPLQANMITRIVRIRCNICIYIYVSFLDLIHAAFLFALSNRSFTSHPENRKIGPYMRFQSLNSTFFHRIFSLGHVYRVYVSHIFLSILCRLYYRRYVALVQRGVRFLMYQRGVSACTSPEISREWIFSLQRSPELSHPAGEVR